jgi:hypothetical protein
LLYCVTEWTNSSETRKTSVWNDDIIAKGLELVGGARTPSNPERSLHWDTGWMINPGIKEMLTDTDTIKKELILTLGEQWPYWDIGWMSDPIMRTTLANSINTTKGLKLTLRGRTLRNLKRSSHWDTGWVIHSCGGKTLAKGTNAIEKGFELIFGSRTPRDPEQLSQWDTGWTESELALGRQTSHNLKSPSSWDTGWNIHFVLRKVLAGNRIKKETLRSELNPGNRSDTRIPASKRAIRSSKSSPNSQSNREPAGTEEGNQIKDLKTSSVPPSLPATVLILEVAVVATKTQNLYTIEWNKSEKLKNGAVESPQNTLQPVQVEVRREYTGHYERIKTYRETKTARMNNVERNKYQTAKTEVSDDRDKGGTYQMREQSDPERPRKGQRQCKINWVYQPDDQNKRTI